MRRFVVLIIIGLAFTGLLVSRPASAGVTLAQRLSGRILLQVESYGRVWYVSPLNQQRYFLKDDPSSLEMFKMLSVAMSVDNLNLIPLAGSTEPGNAAFRAKFSGRIVRQSATSTMWYVSPLNRQRYALGDLPRTALKKLALGISNANINLIPAAYGFNVPSAPIRAVNGLLRTQRSVVTSRGTYTVDVMTLDASVSTLKIMADTAQNVDCKTGCTTLPLKTYVDRRTAVAGMHGTYFCPYDYASCAGQTGYYFYPVFNSFTGKMINEVRMKYTVQPIVAIDTTNRLFYYSPTLQFHSLAELKTRFADDSRDAGGSGVLRAAISSSPIMVKDGQNVLDTRYLDTKQATVKSYRGFIGWKGRTVTFGIVRGATVKDSAAVAAAMGLDYAVNLDGGGSTALYQGGKYIIGPGRNLPNAILLVP
jgi:hypothetical protein